MSGASSSSSSCGACAALRGEFEEFQEQSRELEAELENELKATQEQLAQTKAKIDKVSERASR